MRPRFSARFKYLILRNHNRAEGRQILSCSLMPLPASMLVLYSRPPPAVQTVLTAVAIMLGHQEPTWSEVRRVSEY